MKIVRSINSTINRLNVFGEIITSYRYSESQYNENGHLTVQVLLNEDGEIESKSMFELDDVGNIQTQVHYERRNDLVERTEYFDTEEATQYKTEITTGDGSKTIHEYRYNQLGNTDQITIKNDDGSIEGYEIFKFNNDGLLIEEIKVNESYIPLFSKRLTYTEDQQISKEEFFDDANRLHREIKYHFNEDNLLVEKIDSQLDGGTITINKYSYDLVGNQILDETFQNGVLTFKNQSKYDDENNLIEEKVVQIGQENFIEIIQHEIMYYPQIL